MSVTITRRSQGPAGQDFNGNSDFADLSADGLYVAFSTEATNAFLADSNGVVDLWRQNRATGVLDRVSLATNGAATDGASFGPAISGDGRYVAFSSFATNLTLNDGNGFADVFRKDMDTGAVLIVSAAPDGLPANSVSFGAAISADGRHVAFLSAASNIVANDQNNSIDVFLRDMVTSVTRRVDLAADGTEASAGAINRPALSADARFVAFDSVAGNLTANDTNARDDVFVKDMQTGAIRRVSEGANGEALTGGFEGILKPAISADGRYVVFATAVAMLAADTNGVADIYRRDLLTGALARVSTGGLGAQGNAESRDADISADGRLVSFTSLASNFAPGDGQQSADIFLKDMVSGALTLLSRSAAGTPGFGQSTSAAISGDGATVAFSSAAPDLVAGDGNAMQDIFTARIGPPAGTQIGTEGDDLLVGGDGADRLEGRGGDDVLQGNAGADYLDGGAGRDTILGGPGNDAMLGGTGDDTFQVDAPGDSVIEREDEGQDTVFVLISGWAMPANLETARLAGDGAALTGGEGAEQLVSNASLASSLDGSGGDDVLWGQAPDDTLGGGAGDDVLRGGGGADSMLGGAGDDQAIIEQPGDVFVELPGEGLDTAWVTASGWTLAANVEIGRLAGTATLLLGSAGGQALVANPLYASRLLGGAGNDELYGAGGADTLAGGAGDDVLRGSQGADLMQGSMGNDVFVVEELGDVIEEAAGEGYDTAYVAVDGYTLGPNIEVAYLAGLATRLNGSQGADNLVANPLLGGALDGRGGADTLYGSGLADLLAGGAGDDVLWGFAGADRFAFHIADWGQDWVMDFNRAEGDRLDFRGSGMSGFGQFSVIGNGPNTILLYGQAAVTLRGITDIAAADCIF